MADHHGRLEDRVELLVAHPLDADQGWTDSSQWWSTRKFEHPPPPGWGRGSGAHCTYITGGDGRDQVEWSIRIWRRRHSEFEGMARRFVHVIRTALRQAWGRLEYQPGDRVLACRLTLPARFATAEMAIEIRRQMEWATPGTGSSVEILFNPLPAPEQKEEASDHVD